MIVSKPEGTHANEAETPPRPAGRAVPFGPLDLLVLCVLFYVANNIIWLALDDSSPSYDKAAHARFALHYLRLFQAPTRLSLHKLLAVTQYWPPLFHLATVPVTMALGFSVQKVAAANLLFLPVAVFATYKVGRRLFDEWVGAAAVVLTLLYPMVYALSREVLVDFTLLAMVTLSLHMILESDAGLDRRHGAWLGATLGAAMLAKWTAITFLIGPGLVWLWVSVYRARPHWRSVVASLSLVLVVAALVAAPWYYEAFGRFLERAHVAFGSDPAQEGDPTALIDSLQWYWSAAKAGLILPLLLVPTGAGVLLSFLQRRPWPGAAFLWACILPPLAFFLLIPNKDARFIAPMLPAVAILAAAGIQAVPWKAVRVVTWVFVVAAGVGQFYAISFGQPIALAHTIAHPPRHANWRMEEMVVQIGTLEVPRPIRIGFLPNDPDFEPNIFMLAADVNGLNAQIDGLGQVNEPIGAWDRYDVIVSKTGRVSIEYAAEFREPLRAALRAWIDGPNRGPHIARWKTWPLPDQSRAEVYVVHH